MNNDVQCTAGLQNIMFTQYLLKVEFKNTKSQKKMEKHFFFFFGKYYKHLTHICLHVKLGPCKYVICNKFPLLSLLPSLQICNM